MTYHPPLFFFKIARKSKIWSLSWWLKSRDNLYFAKKKPNFQAILTKKNLTNTFITPTYNSINYKYPKSGPKTQNQTCLILAFLFRSSFSHHEVYLILWNPWILRKPILVVRNRIINEFLSTL